MPTQETYFAYGLVLETGGKNQEAADAFFKAEDIDPRGETGLNAAMEIEDSSIVNRKLLRDLLRFP
jgi:hypothetical protein